MSYAITALTPSRLIDLRTNSAAEVRRTIVEARAEGAQTVDISRDGKSISEIDLAKLATALGSATTVTKYA